ncbi:MAG: hypothetical protein E3J29_02115, partial [Dehalococcoidia bacterium]
MREWFGNRRRNWRERHDYRSRISRRSVARPSPSRWLLSGAAAAVLVGIASLFWLAPGLRASGGDFHLDFIAAENTTYHQNDAIGTEGYEIGPAPEGNDLGYDDRTKNIDVVEQLEAEDFTCEDRIIFLPRVRVDEGATDADQTIFLTYHFDARNNGKQAVGYKEVVPMPAGVPGTDAVGISFVDFSPSQTGDDGNIALSGNEDVTLVSQRYLNKPQYQVTGTVPVDFPTNPADNPDVEVLEVVVKVEGLDAGEQLIARIDVRFSCFATDPTGNLHAALFDAFVDADGDLATTNDRDPITSGSGRQDIPMLGLGELPTPTPTFFITTRRTPSATP